MTEVGYFYSLIHISSFVFGMWSMRLGFCSTIHRLCTLQFETVISGLTIFEISMQRKGRGSSVMLVLSWKMVRCGGPSLLVLQEHKSAKLFSTHH